jgi:hypothetical protein
LCVGRLVRDDDDDEKRSSYSSLFPSSHEDSNSESMDGHDTSAGREKWLPGPSRDNV